MRVRPVVLAAILSSLVAAAPAAAASEGGGGQRKGTITLDVAVKKFAVSQRQIVGRGELTARLTDNRGASQTARRPVRFAVSAQSGNCRILTLTLDDLQLELLGLKVDVSTVNLRLFGIPRGEGSGVLGRLFCSLARSSIRLRGSIRAADHARKVVRALNSRMKGRPMRALGVRATLTPDAESAQLSGPSCKVLRLVVGPLDLNLLGLVVLLYGENRRTPVTLTIDAFPGQGALGDLFCSLAGPPTP
jgi:hypothetical protein